MSVTVQEIFNMTMAFADEIDDTGIINPTNTASYRVRTPGILTSLQAELIKPGDVFKTHEISNKPTENMLGAKVGFDILEFTGEEIIKEADGSVKAYYFEVDGEGTVYIEDYNGIWNTLTTVNVPSTVTDFTAYKGVVVPSSGATKSRIRFTGTYRYLITNYAMFSVAFQPSRVPDYRPWVKKEMPSDFKVIDQIINEYFDRQYDKDTNFKWEGRKDLYIDYFYEGNIRIIYRPVPSVITALTDTLELDDVTCRTILPYALGMELFKEENEDIYLHFRNRFQELKGLADRKQPIGEISITDMYCVNVGW